MSDLSNLTLPPSPNNYVTSKNLDIVAVTETWLKHDETKSAIADISLLAIRFFTNLAQISGHEEV